MSKFVFKLPIIALLLIMTFSFAGCGGGSGGGGGNGGDVDPIAGYWYVEKVTSEDEKFMEFPHSEVGEEGVVVDLEMILGFVEKKMYKYEKLSIVHPETGEKVSQVFYKPDEVKSYSIDGNKAKYEGGTLTFAVTGNSATFILEDENGKNTLSVHKIDASAVEGAEPKTDDDDGDGDGGSGG